MGSGWIAHPAGSQPSRQGSLQHISRPVQAGLGFQKGQAALQTSSGGPMSSHPLLGHRT